MPSSRVVQRAFELEEDDAADEPSKDACEVVWRDPTTKLRLAPGAVQNWPTAASEAWIVRERKAIADFKKTKSFVNLSSVHTDH